MSVTKEMIYFINLTTLERLSAQYIPLELKYNRDAELAEVKIIGRNEPKFQFTGGSTKMPMTLEFIAEEIDRDDVIRKIKWLETLTMADGYRKAQPKVKIVWGKLFRNEVWYLRSVKPTFSLFNPGMNMMPSMCVVDLEFVQSPTDNPLWQDVSWTPASLNSTADIVNPQSSNLA